MRGLLDTAPQVQRERLAQPSLCYHTLVRSHEVGNSFFYRALSQPQPAVLSVLVLRLRPSQSPSLRSSSASRWPLYRDLSTALRQSALHVVLLSVLPSGCGSICLYSGVGSSRLVPLIWRALRETAAAPGRPRDGSRRVFVPACRIKSRWPWPTPSSTAVTFYPFPLLIRGLCWATLSAWRIWRPNTSTILMCLVEPSFAP